MRSALRITCSVVAATAMACGNSEVGQDPEQEEIQSVENRITLAQFQDCTELETYIENTAVKQMRSMYEEGYWGWGRFGGPEMAANDAAGAAPPAAEKGPSYSETNTQVAGVDEADFVKTDGERIFYILGRQLYVIDSWPAEETKVDATVEIEGYPSDMFLAGSKLVVFSSVPRPQPTSGSGAAPGGARDDIAYWGWGYGGDTKISVFDVSTNTPAAVGAYYLSGSYANSRRIGDSVRVVLSDDVRWPELRYDYNSADPFGLLSNRQEVMAENEQRIRNQTLDQWLPRSYVVVGGQKVEIPADCTQFHRPTGATRLGLATVATLDLANLAGGVRQTTVVSETGEIYSSLENLYIATPHWWWGRSGDQKDHTYLHKFDVTQRDRVAYVGSGAVEGHIVDQFSMDEHNGFLRIATTINSWSVSTEPNGAPRTSTNTTENKVFVLAERSGALEVVGQTPPLAPGEQIYSSRFAGDRGFVVTYRQVDPLFTLDLKDPTQPKVVGELKIPGFSTYIHMLDDNHLLTIGNETTTSGGRELRTGMALQIFDVTDMTKPVQADKVVIGSQSSWSDALHDHKAFNYFPRTGTLAIPFTDWNYSGDYWSSFLSAVKLFKVDGTTYKVTPAGQIEHSDLYRTHNRNHWDYWYMPWVRRSVQIEGYVYSFSYAGLKVNQVSDLATVRSIAFQPTQQQ